ncbi:hypothetical protein [Pseudomonas halotolerans]|uniref:hypothetical protein n=1 Tax=Pseudomonas halotolerans TaxID=3143552 RepID=UPI0031DEB70F
MTYEQRAFLFHIDQKLINGVKALSVLASGGERTPYPQKRQQRLGVILTVLWKTAYAAGK